MVAALGRARGGAAVVALAAVALVACGGGSPRRGGDDAAAPIAVASRPDAALPPTDAVAVDAAAVDAGVDHPGLGVEHTVTARFVSGNGPIIACGVIAFVGVYVYEVESVNGGPPLAGRIVVDVLCPDFAVSAGVRFAPGQVHRLTLGPARSSYAGARAPRSPAPALPRFAAESVRPR